MGQKGLLDLALLKFHLNRLCLSTIMDALWADAKAKEMLRSTTGGFRMHRDHFGRPSDEVRPSNAWMALIPASLQKFSELHRRMVYCLDYDGVLKNLCRAGNSAEDVLDEPPSTAMMDAIEGNEHEGERNSGSRLYCWRHRRPRGSEP